MDEFKYLVIGGGSDLLCNSLTLRLAANAVALRKEPPQAAGDHFTSAIVQGYVREEGIEAVQLPDQRNRCGPSWRFFGPQISGEYSRGGEVEHQRGGQPQAGGGIQPVTQFHRGQRVEPQVPERPAGPDGLRGGVAKHGSGLGSDQVHQHPILLSGGQARQLLSQCGTSTRGSGPVILGRISQRPPALGQAIDPRARPPPPHGPHATEAAASPRPRRPSAKASRNAFAAAYPGCIPLPHVAAIEENSTNCSRPIPAVSSSRYAAPAALAATTAASSAAVLSSRAASCARPAACITATSGGPPAP